MLSTAHRVLDGTPILREGSKKPVVCGYEMVDPNMDALMYKATHINHPSNVWVRQSSEHYTWLMELFVALSLEYDRRYNKQHKTFTKLFKVLASPPVRIAHDPFVPPPQAMPDEYKDDDTITVQNGLVVLPTNTGVGFAPWATVISKEEPEIKMSKKHIVYIAEVQEDVCKKYNDMFGSKLITPDKKKLIV